MKLAICAVEIVLMVVAFELFRAYTDRGTWGIVWLFAAWMVVGIRDGVMAAARKDTDE